MVDRQFEYSDKLNNFLNLIESSQSVGERQRAVQSIAQSQDPEAGRLLVDLYSQIPWRETKKLIVAALAYFPNSKSLEFLIGLASHDTDLDIAAAALNALGSANVPQAGEFLLSFIKNNRFSLKKEAIIALCYNIDMPLADELEALSATLVEDGLNASLPHILLACSKRGYRQAWPQTMAMLSSLGPSSESSAAASFVMAAAYYGENEALATLRESAFSSNPASKHLLLMALEFSRLVGVEAIEDLCLRFDLQNPTHYPSIIRNLSRFAKADAWNFLLMMKQEGKASADLDCLAHAHFFASQADAEECLNLLVQNHQHIALPYQAYLVRSLLKASPDNLTAIKERLPSAHFLKLCEHVMIAEPLSHLGLYLQPERSDQENIAAINALTWQCLMRTKKDGLSLEVGRYLHAQLLDHNPKVSSRLVRGLGQINYVTKALTSTLEAHLQEASSPLNLSIFRYLKQLADPALCSLLLDRLGRILQADPESEPHTDSELAALLGALSAFDTLPTPERLGQIPARQRDKHRAALIPLVACHRLDGFSDFIASCLDHPAFQIRIAAIAAVKLNGTPILYNKLLQLLKHPDVSLRDHAAYSLSSASESFQMKALKALQAQADASSALASFIKNFEVAAGSNYSALIEFLRANLTSEKPPFHQEDLIEAGHNLLDNLLLTLSEANAPQAGGSAAAAIPKHSIDQAIRQDLPNISSYSDPIKSMIRNAELTLRNPNLFNSTVDKSTVVIEYVKAIDLILQERLGSQFFGRNRERMLAGMRSRVIALAIDERDTQIPQLLRNLRCQNQFDSNNFPFAKLVSMVQALLSGKIMANPYKVVDGLRAWAIMIILFARPLKIDTHEFEPMVSLGQMGVGETTDLCYRLNALQEIRNQAAHHGTMLEYDKLIEIRKGCFDVLVKLTAAKG